MGDNTSGALPRGRRSVLGTCAGIGRVGYKRNQTDVDDAMTAKQSVAAATTDMAVRIERTRVSHEHNKRRRNCTSQVFKPASTSTEPTSQTQRSRRTKSGLVTHSGAPKAEATSINLQGCRWRLTTTELQGCRWILFNTVLPLTSEQEHHGGGRRNGVKHKIANVVFISSKTIRSKQRVELIRIELIGHRASRVY